MTERFILDPSQEYTTLQQNQIYETQPEAVINYRVARAQFLEDRENNRKSRKMQASPILQVEMEEDVIPLDRIPVDQLPPPSRPGGYPFPAPVSNPNGARMYEKPIGPALPLSLINQRDLKRYETVVTRRSMQPGERVRLAGDKKDLIVGYKSNSLCRNLVQDCIERAYLAASMLDEKHANIIRARLTMAGVKNSNANHADTKAITFNKAVSIAQQAEAWVYAAQAAAAKSMVKESKRCLHALAGRRRKTTQEKEALYEKRYGRPRGTRAERATRKYQKRIENLGQ